MLWFKHDADAATDAKIKKLLMRYGTDGYAIYFHCIELIVGNVSESNITFELEHDAEIIADNLKIQGTTSISPVDRVNEIMRYIVNLGLFEETNGHIYCYKILKRLDSSMTSNVKMRALIADAKQSHNTVMMPSCQSHDDVMMNLDSVMQEENRTEEIRTEEIRTDNKSKKKTVVYSQEFENFWDCYPRREGKCKAYSTFNSLLKSGKTVELIHKRLKTYKERIRAMSTEYQYIRQPSTFLNNLDDYADGFVPQPKQTGPELRVNQRSSFLDLGDE